MLLKKNSNKTNSHLILGFRFQGTANHKQLIHLELVERGKALTHACHILGSIFFELVHSTLAVGRIEYEQVLGATQLNTNYSSTMSFITQSYQLMGFFICHWQVTNHHVVSRWDEYADQLPIAPRNISARIETK